MRRSTVCAVLLAVAVLSISVYAQQEDAPLSNEAPAAEENTAPTAEATDSEVADKSKFKELGDPPGAKRLSPQGDAWIDPKRKLVIFDGEVVLNEGPLEMFACPRQTKEHESIVSADVEPYVIHAALMAVGAEPGRTVQFDPEYVAASGTPIKIMLLWYDKEGNKQIAKAQEWVRNAQTGEQMKYDWVFGGSGFWFDEATGKRHYMAEGGDFICVSNFPTAMLDLPVESTQANEGLLFEANPKTVPPRGTPVRVVLMPQLDEKKNNERGADTAEDS